MRSPTDMPGRAPRRRSGLSRGRVLLIVLAVALFVLVTSLRGLAGFYTDYLWFDSLGFAGVWGGVLGAKIALTVIFTGLFFVLLWVNLLIADRIAPKFRPPGPEEDFVERYRELVGRRTGAVRAAVALVFALIAGLGVSGQWNDWILFTNYQSFGVKDPLFNTDVGFYVFRLPFLSFVVSWLFAAFVIIIIVTAVAHYLNGGIRFQTPIERVTPQVKAHLSVLLGVLALLRAAGYWLDRYKLTYSTRGTVDGATYTDVKAQLPAINLLILISLFAFVLLLVNIRRRGWVLPVIAVGLWAFVAVVAGAIYPAFIQRFQVEPDESTKEKPYIARNIEATRAALNLDEVEVDDFAYQDDLTVQDLRDNAQTLRNVRLLDPAIVEPTFQRLQGIRAFYRFNDLDVDRYQLSDETTQVLLSARELDTAEVPQQSWEGRHLAYTHGYAVAMAPSNRVSASGRPDFNIRDLPPVGLPQLTRPEIYFGENLGSYAIVDTNRDEVNYVRADGTTEVTRYSGEGGVGIGSFFRRAAFALRFGDINPLISDFITGDSRILFIRDVRERVQTVAPFLRYDADPYPVVLDGELVWVLDAYTVTDQYPYAQRAVTGQLPPGSGLDTRFNYVRNSVKAVVDAYDGTVTFYIFDEQDPIAEAYRQAFPELFKSRDELPEGLEDHLRFPEDLFRTQTTMWGRYHLEDAAEFYAQTDSWSVAQSPGTIVGAPTQETATTNAQGELGPARERRIDPYYLLMQLPDSEGQEFVLLRPFVPFSENDSRKELVAFMVARSDPENYGKLQSYVMPRNRLPDGPAIVDATINSQEEISREITLLDQRGSTVLQGNLLLIPVEDSLIYVRPLYVQASGATAVPELKKVIVSYAGRAFMRDTLPEALLAIFSVDIPADQLAATLEEIFGTPVEPGAGGDTGDTGGGTGGEVTPPPEGATVSELLAQAATAFAEADAALRAGDLATYQAKVEQARALVVQAATLAGVEVPTTLPPDTSTSETTPPDTSTIGPPDESTSTTAPEDTTTTGGEQALARAGPLAVR
ncbi:MAG: UPF0182 family protein [Acidimicrobiales bacterium]|nr:UPF0182 family protein [Acidimicrobiales bacterium]